MHCCTCLNEASAGNICVGFLGSLSERLSGLMPISLGVDSLLVSAELSSSLDLT